MTTPTLDNYNNTQGQTNNNYTQDNLKLATIHARQIRIQHVQKVKCCSIILTSAPCDVTKHVTLLKTHTHTHTHTHTKTQNIPDRHNNSTNTQSKHLLQIVQCVRKVAVHLNCRRVQLNCDGTRWRTGSGLYRSPWTLLPMPFVSAQRFCELSIPYVTVCHHISTGL